MEETLIKAQKTSLAKWVLGTLAVLLFVVAAAVFLLFYVNRFSLELAVLGEPEVILEYGEAYQEQGGTAVLKGSLFWKNGVFEVPVEISGALNAAKPGKYTLQYHANYRWWQTSAQRNVRVVDTVCPVIRLEPDPEGATLHNGEYIEAGYQATDNLDGDITDKVVRIVQEGLVTYAVTDSSGNPAYAEREIPTYDTLPPEIVLDGGDSITAFVGEYMEEPGFRATDAEGTDLTDSVEVNGEVIWYRPGTYDMVYSVTDGFDNTTTVTRQVTIAAKSPKATVHPDGKVIYLTFDDGPGPYTEYLLDVLRAYDVKATFFVVDTGNDEILKKIAEEGHSIGIHSMTHDYGQIYASPEAYFRDLLGMQQKIFEVTGEKTYLMRFPGGSSNTVSRRYNEGIMTTLSTAVEAAGFRFFDWNVDSDDAGSAHKTQTVIRNVEEGAQQNRISVVLQHDVHPYSVYAVEDIIAWGLENGYQFLPLQEDSETAHHGISN